MTPKMCLDVWVAALSIPNIWLRSFYRKVVACQCLCVFHNELTFLNSVILTMLWHATKSANINNFCVTRFTRITYLHVKKIEQHYK